MRAVLSSEDEPEDLEWGRLSELQRRNTLCLPHMRSCYPVELATAAPTDDDALEAGETLDDSLDVRTGAQKRALSASSDTMADENVEASLRKRKVIIENCVSHGL